jgi:molecular chaperone GrpE
MSDSSDPSQAEPALDGSPTPDMPAEAPASDGGDSVALKLTQLQQSLDALGRQISYIPPQVRALGSKVEGLGAAISDSRYRGLLLGLLGVLDIVEQIQRVMAGGADEAVDHARNYEVLRVQLRQLLENNGLTEIPASGAFDPNVHRALERVETGDPADHNRVLQVLRPGYRTEQSVLRYAEVKVGYFPPPS